MGSFFSTFEIFGKSSANCAGNTLSMRTCQGCPVISHHWTFCCPGALGCWWLREWGQSEDLGPEQCLGVSDHCVLGESLCLSHYVLGGIHCIPPSWLEPIGRTVLPSCPCIPWESEPLDECSCYRAGAWARSREKLE